MQSDLHSVKYKERLDFKKDLTLRLPLLIGEGEKSSSFQSFGLKPIKQSEQTPPRLQGAGINDGDKSLKIFFNTPRLPDYNRVIHPSREGNWDIDSPLERGRSEAEGVC
jgi:hypothetical protein